MKCPEDGLGFVTIRHHIERLKFSRHGNFKFLGCIIKILLSKIVNSNYLSLPDKSALPKGILGCLPLIASLFFSVLIRLDVLVQINAKILNHQTMTGAFATAKEDARCLQITINNSTPEDLPVDFVALFDQLLSLLVRRFN